MVRVLKFGHTPRVINIGTTAQTEKSLTNSDHFCTQATRIINPISRRTKVTNAQASVNGNTSPSSYEPELSHKVNAIPESSTVVSRLIAWI